MFAGEGCGTNDRSKESGCIIDVMCMLLYDSHSLITRSISIKMKATKENSFVIQGIHSSLYVVSSLDK